MLGETRGMPQPCPLLVFTDLDGTLLDHDTYQWDSAAPALRRLKAIGAPVILSSSKTEAEIRAVQSDLGLAGVPAIVENGAGLIGMPNAAPSEEEYTALRERLDALPHELRSLFRGFGDMSDEAVAEATGLSLTAARLARNRAFSEPGLWLGDDAALSEFSAALGQQGIAARQGGRFLTLSFGMTKADRMTDIVAYFRPARTAALGDAPNDIEMVEAADFGIIVANPHRDPLPPLDGEAAGRIIRTTQAGPVGWNSAMLALLDRLDHIKEEPHG